MRRILILAAVIALFTAPAPVAQGPGVEPVEPFKVGTFDIHGVPHVGLVLRDSLVIDIEIATYALEAHPEYPHVPMPEDMLELIGRWDYGLKYRLFEMVNYVVNNDLLTGDGRADYVYDVSELRTRPPIMYPGKILNAAVNFYSHVFEGATPEERAAEMRRRREERGVPYLFQKPSRGAVVGNGDPIVIPSTSRATLSIALARARVSSVRASVVRPCVRRARVSRVRTSHVCACVSRACVVWRHASCVTRALSIRHQSTTQPRA